MLKKYKRDWAAFGAGSSVTGALVGAMLHNPLVLVLNMLVLALDIYLWEDALKGESDDVH